MNAREVARAILPLARNGRGTRTPVVIAIDGTEYDVREVEVVVDPAAPTRPRDVRIRLIADIRSGEPASS